MNQARDVLETVRDILPAAAVVLSQTRGGCPPCPSLACPAPSRCPELSCATPVLNCPAVTCGSCECPVGQPGAVGLLALSAAALLGAVAGAGACYLRFHLRGEKRRSPGAAAEASPPDAKPAEPANVTLALATRRVAQERIRHAALTDGV